MGTISEYHRYLFLGKVTGTLSSAEKQELEQLFAENKDAEGEYWAFVSTLPSGDVNSSFERISGEGFWKDHTPKEIVRQKKQARVRLVVAVSVLLLVTAGTALFLSGEAPEPPALAVVATKPANTIQLKLANGKTIDLNEQTGKIDGGDVQLLNQDGVLTYSENLKASAGMNSIEVPVGMTYRVQLSDGSTVWMNSATRIEFPLGFTGDRREISVSGEAYLDIAKNIAQPFIVKLPDAVVEVTGTAFNINTYDSAFTRVSLVTGGLNLLAATQSIRIVPGRQAVLDELSGHLFDEGFDAKKTLSWREGLFYFDRASLEEIAKVLHRWYGIKTVVEKKELSSKRFAGILNKNEPVEVFLDNLRNITRIQTSFDQEGVLHFN